MKFPHRRQFLHLAAGAAALPFVPHVAMAQSYPTRPVRLLVGDAAGGAPDTIARLMGPWLSERLGQPVVVDNRPGAGTTIATEAVVRAFPDGHTLLTMSSSQAIAAALYDKLNFNFVRDIAPVAGIARSPLIMVVNPSFHAKSLQEFIAYAKDNPSAINMASAGIGTAPHMAGELFKIMSGVSMVHVPFRGGPPALTAVLGGQVQVYFVATSSSIELINAGKLRPLAVTTATRWIGLPEVPSVIEFVPEYEASVWFGIGAPKGTPAALVERLNKEINAALANTEMKARIADLGATVLPGSSADFGKLIADETEKWGTVVRALNIKAE
jgi:tripartite-type tricarboxylate transporter receptor subunit TctC